MRSWLPALLLLLAGCASIPQPEEGQRQLSGQAPDIWHAQGRFAYRGEENRNGQFDWQQQGDTFQIRLFGTFGLGSVRIEGNPSYAVITQGEDQWFSDTPELTLYQLTGLALPLDHLADWMTGRPPELDESTWQVSYSNLQQVSAFTLPGRIDLGYSRTSLILLINSWQLPDV